MNTVTTITIGVAEDQDIYRNGLIGMLNNVPHFNVIIDSNSGKDMLVRLKETQPNVVLLDYRMEGMNGIETAAKINRHYPDVRILMLSMYDAQEFVLRAIENGANGYITKDDDPAEIVSAIESVMATGYYLNDRTSKILISQMVKSGAVKPIFSYENVQFTDAEYRVINLICREYSTIEISKLLFKSKRTVDGHRATIMKKMGVKNAIGIVMYAVKNELFEVQVGRWIKSISNHFRMHFFFRF